MPALLTRSISFLKRSSALPKPPEEENRASTAYEIEEFLRCLPPSTPTPPSAPHHHHTSHHSPNPSTSSTLTSSIVILPPSPPPTDVPPVPPPSYNSLERGYYNSSACLGSLPYVHVHSYEHMPIPVHVQDTQETQPQHQRSSSREKNRLLNLRVETDLDFGRRGREPVLVYRAASAEEPRRARREEISQWSWA
ncbi:hypothetical protein C7212DRAFT_328983 [Tuber magnatum]|uniref:Uncharacterized protein n=1 Tax=Tuber magnatum TaxID=42249 RepID=A0A317SIV5_9PEZI|nr:hypothetical protein C7212DRAFT_328983 [Tuber magnatum]